CRNKQKVLVVGEGDYSFSLSLAKAFGSAVNITAISLGIREHKYNTGEANVKELKRLGCTVVHGVNIHSMISDNRLTRYDRIVFNYPHAGKRQGIVGEFMESAREMVNGENGEIHVTHKTIYPFNELDIKTIAEEKGLRLIKQMQFNKWIFSGYSNKLETGSNCDSSFSFRIRSVVTFMFKK
ncbi:unnamed protein product, partial [Thlaspi arvense]